MKKVSGSGLLLCVAALIGCVEGGGPGSHRDAHVEAPDTAIADAHVTPEEDAPGVDADGDGVPVPADCDDTTNEVSPLATEDCLTTRDEDCDGEGTDLDLDCDVDEDIDEDVDEDEDDEEEDDEEDE